MDFFELVKKRCSTREYDNRLIAWHDLEKIVDCGRLAPTARKEEPWEFVVITDKDALSHIASLAPNGRFIESAAACITVLSRDVKYYLEDGSAATENMLLAATALGIGSCWIAGDKKDYASSVLSYLEAPAGYRLVSIISLGYPRISFNTCRKRPLSDVLHKEKF